MDFISYDDVDESERRMSTLSAPTLNVWVSSYKLDRGGRHGICSGMHHDAGMGIITKRVLINEVIVINLGYPYKISSVGTTTRRLSVWNSWNRGGSEIVRDNRWVTSISQRGEREGNEHLAHEKSGRRAAPYASHSARRTLRKVPK